MAFIESFVPTEFLPMKKLDAEFALERLFAA
jgi:hypothetical protein